MSARKEWKKAWRWVRCGCNPPPKKLRNMCTIALSAYLDGTMPSVYAGVPKTLLSKKFADFACKWRDDMDPKVGVYLLTLLSRRIHTVWHDICAEDPAWAYLKFVNSKRALLGLEAVNE